MKKIAIIITAVAVLTFLILTEPAAQATTVHPTGDSTQDLPNVQNAVDQGGIVLLKATNEAGEPTAFQFPSFDPRDLTAATGVTILNGVVITGETVDGSMTTIRNGGGTFWVGWDTAPDGDVVIQGIHFDDPGSGAIIVHNVTGKVCIKNNKITADLWSVFKDTQAPRPLSADSALAWTKLFYFSDVQQWQKIGVQVGGVVGPGIPPSVITGTVMVKDNYIDFETGLPSNLTPPTFDNPWCWWHTFGLGDLLTDATVHYEGNTIRNCTARGIMTADPLGITVVDNNTIELGPLGSYNLGFPWSAVAIEGLYGWFGLPPDVGGSVHILNNTVVGDAKDKAGIAVWGLLGKRLAYACILNNIVTVTDGFVGIGITDLDRSIVVHNAIRGSAQFGVNVGTGLADPAAPLATTRNILTDINFTGFQSSVADIAFADDTEDNILFRCNETTLLDLGTDNHIH